MMSQTDITHNRNKCFVVQLLKEDEYKSYMLWSSWGRVGEKRHQTSLIPFGDNLENAKNAFRQKFLFKSGNRWEDGAI
jgi:predicted DNA-binding WGR domain protein